jgi:hypothetical protein
MIAPESLIMSYNGCEGGGSDVLQQVASSSTSELLTSDLIVLMSSVSSSNEGSMSPALIAWRAVSRLQELEGDGRGTPLKRLSCICILAY